MSNGFEDLRHDITDDIHAGSEVSRGTLSILSDAVLEEMSRIYDNLIPLVKESHYINTAIGDDLDEVGKLFKLFRFGGESDTEFRARILLYVATLETCTPDAIKNIFKALSGQYPLIVENWTTQLYNFGDIIQENTLLAQFRCVLPYDITKVNEVVTVIDDGSGEGLTVQCSNTNFAPDEGVSWFADAWDNADTDHDTSIIDSIDTNTGIITLQAVGGGIGGKFPKGYKIDIYYEITPDSSWSLTNIESYELILDRYKAAGVDAVLQIQSSLTEWLSGDQEVIGITEELYNFSVDFGNEDVDIGEPTVIGGSGHWATAYWGNSSSRWGATGYSNPTLEITE
jgi:hypothetical protein